MTIVSPSLNLVFIFLACLEANCQTFRLPILLTIQYVICVPWWLTVGRAATEGSATYNQLAQYVVSDVVSVSMFTVLLLKF